MLIDKGLYLGKNPKQDANFKYVHHILEILAKWNINFDIDQIDQ